MKMKHLASIILEFSSEHSPEIFAGVAIAGVAVTV